MIKDTSKYILAAEVERVAKQLIEGSVEHDHLPEARIRYIFRTGKWNSKSKTVLGQAKKASEDVRFLGQYDFVIIINEEAWKAAPPAGRIALIDHELCHCGCKYDKQDNKIWEINPHDCAEFNSVIRRHGLWEEDVRKLVDAASGAPVFQGSPDQTKLFEQTGAPATDPVN